MWIQENPVLPPLGGHVTPEANEGGEWSGSWKLLGKTESHHNERDPEAVQVWDCMVEGRLIRIVWYYLYQKMHLLFGSLFHKNSIIKRA
jgi:hypothetical protein